MFIVRELNFELTTAGRVAEREPDIVSRRDFRMADGTDRRFRSSEKLLAMAADAGIVIGIVGNIWILAHFAPIAGRDFVAGEARGLVLLC